jgi:TRAP-type mannitol/chloroaromatic compound transport system substrate-binding protein
MKRRDWLQGAAVAAAATTLAACGKQTAPAAGDAAGADQSPRTWKMVTAWPANFPGLGTGAQALADLITRASGGRLSVKVYGGGELVPPFEVFDAVSRGTAEMGHSASYYWKGKSEAAPFFSAVPFGMNAQEMNGWLQFGGGIELWRELYSGFNLVPFAAGNTGVQMAGWFNREIRSLADLAGLKMRIPGLGGEVMARLGVTTVNLPGAELFTALQSGAIDAAEWVGPYNDLAFGLHRVAKYCYYPGWQEPGPTLECMIHKSAFDALPEDLRALVDACCRAVND